MRKYKNLFIGIFVMVIVGFAAHYFFQDGLNFLKQLTDFASLKAYLESFGSSSMFVGVLLYALQILIAVLPGEFIEVLFGFMYGSWGGMAFCIVGNCIGSTLIFILTKRYGTRFVKRFVNDEKMSKIQLFHDPRKLNMLTFVLFMIPGTPKDVFTYLLGLTPMKLSTFLLISSVARIPSIFSSTLVGANLGQNMWKEAILIYALTGVLSLFGYLFYRKKFSQQA